MLFGCCYFLDIINIIKIFISLYFLRYLIIEGIKLVIYLIYIYIWNIEIKFYVGRIMWNRYR